MITKRLMHDELKNKNLFQLNSINKCIRNKYTNHVSDFFNPSIFAFAMLSLAGTIAFFYMIWDYLSPREKEIVHETIDLKSNAHHGYIVDADNFEYAGEKPCGELSGCIVRDKRTGKLYVEKGARSIDALIKEFLIATFLNKVRPGEQPGSLILEKKREDGKVRLYTLSEMYPDSMDLHEFIMQGDFIEKFAKKPLVGLEQALASDFMFAKQDDIKFANLVIIEREDAYVVATIDHEISGKGVHAKRVFTSNIDALLSGIRDASNMIGVNDDHPESFVDNDLAMIFLREAKRFMRVEKIDEFYEKVAAIDMNEIIAIVNDISGNDGLIDTAKSYRYINEMNDIIREAKHYISIREHNMTDEPEHDAGYRRRM